ncbi:hypothetical protein A6U84_25710 (plasmid) [Agrobacterium sp. 13-2099-1-2]|uniref:hypothetical protein n=1 Tax=Agrobacterium sp. 13-2099-1-2 TaxID=1841651 RepID=UPI0022A9B57E|nr:hypothetical protein [Agrobacterium sp. 13-2099-1-2]UZX45539.1 hypothetical protein A6U84_25710 [Agrobacterium sp. 13-2099-1-2]
MSFFEKGEGERRFPSPSKDRPPSFLRSLRLRCVSFVQPVPRADPCPPTPTLDRQFEGAGAMLLPYRARDRFAGIEERDFMRSYAYLLDPETSLFRTVPLPEGDGLERFSPLLGANKLDATRFDERHSIVFDVQGLVRGLTSFSAHGERLPPFGGKLLVMRNDVARFDNSPALTIYEVAQRFTCFKVVVDPVYADSDEVTPLHAIIQGAFKGFQLRFVRSVPSVVEGEA